jgi:hypothetical protein
LRIHHDNGTGPFSQSFDRNPTNFWIFAGEIIIRDQSLHSFPQCFINCSLTSDCGQPCCFGTTPCRAS